MFRIIATRTRPRDAFTLCSRDYSFITKSRTVINSESRPYSQRLLTQVTNQNTSKSRTCSQRLLTQQRIFKRQQSSFQDFFYGFRNVHTGAFKGHRYQYVLLFGLAASGAKFYSSGSQVDEEQEQEQEQKKTESLKLAPVELELEHPYEDFSWFWKLFFTTKRAVFLLYLFIPICAATVVHQVFDDSKEGEERYNAFICRSLEKAGCSFQKLGQWMSMRPDMFSESMIRHLSQLRENIPAHDYEDTCKAFEESFGCKIEDIFEKFDAVPIASGTVSQVYHGKLKKEYAFADGVQDVAVKVRHPHVFDETFVDLAFIFLLSKVSGKFQLPFSISEFRDRMVHQLNFKWEAHNISQFAKNFQKETVKGIINFPKVCTQYLSESILIESWADGDNIATIFKEFIVTAKENTQKVISDIDLAERGTLLARELFGMTMKMIFRDNLVHADLHAGNIILTGDDSMTVIDAGLTTTLPQEIRVPVIDFFRGLCTADVDMIVNKLVLFNEKDKEKAVDQDKLRNHVTEMVDQWKKMKTTLGNNESIGDLIGKILTSLPEHNIRLRGDVATSVSTMALTEGLILQLDPDFDIIHESIPYLIQYGSYNYEKTNTVWESPISMNILGF